MTSTAIIGMAAMKVTDRKKGKSSLDRVLLCQLRHASDFFFETLRRKGASQEEISSIPVFRISKEEAEANERCFCLEDYQHDEECRRLPCGHFYHKHVSLRAGKRERESVVVFFFWLS